MESEHAWSRSLPFSRLLVCPSSLSPLLVPRLLGEQLGKQVVQGKWGRLGDRVGEPIAGVTRSLCCSRTRWREWYERERFRGGFLCRLLLDRV